MPSEHKHDLPSYRHVLASEIPLLTSDDGKARIRLVAGRLGDTVGPIVTTGAPFVAHISAASRSVVPLSPVDVDELAVYVMVGAAVISNRSVEAGQLARLTPGHTVDLVTAPGAEILVVGGDPLDAPIHRYGPFVMNSPGDLDRAVRDYQSGRMGRIS